MGQAVRNALHEDVGGILPAVPESYIKGGKFEKYLTDQESKRALPPSFAQLAVAAYTDQIEPKQIT